jgi:hypothetical protein
VCDVGCMAVMTSQTGVVLSVMHAHHCMHCTTVNRVCVRALVTMWRKCEGADQLRCGGCQWTSPPQTKSCCARTSLAPVTHDRTHTHAHSAPAHKVTAAWACFTHGAFHSESSLHADTGRRRQSVTECGVAGAKGALALARTWLDQPAFNNRAERADVQCGRERTKHRSWPDSDQCCHCTADVDENACHVRGRLSVTAQLCHCQSPSEGMEPSDETMGNTRKVITTASIWLALISTLHTHVEPAWVAAVSAPGSQPMFMTQQKSE